MFRTPPPVVLNLMIINGLYWLLCALFVPLYNLSAVWKANLIFARPYEELFQPYQVISYFFTHSLDNFSHILFNMLGLWIFGSNIEYALGSRRFLQFYLFCGISAGLMLAILDPAPNPVLGASTAIFGIMAAMGLLFPDHEILIFPIPIPVKAKYYAFGSFAISFLLWYRDPAGVGGMVSHFGHLAGMVSAVLFFYGRTWWKNLIGPGRRR